MKHILLAMFLVACAKLPTKNSSKRPVWVEQTPKYCEARGLMCASSESSSQHKADMAAKNQLAAIFETEISSEYTNEKSWSGYESLQQNEIREKAHKLISEKTQTVLNGVKIYERENSGDMYYSLAGLDQLSSAKFFKEQLSKHDEQLESLWKGGMKTNLSQMYEHFFQREHYAKRLSVLTGEMKPSPVRFSQLSEFKQQRVDNGGRLYLRLGKLPPRLARDIESQFTSLGFSSVLEGSDYDSKIVGTLKKKSEYFKVKGFVRYKYSLNLKNYNSQGVAVGGLHHQRDGIGRSEAAAYEQVENILLAYIKNNLTDLRIGDK